MKNKTHTYQFAYEPSEEMKKQLRVLDEAFKNLKLSQRDTWDELKNLGANPCDFNVGVVTIDNKVRNVFTPLTEKGREILKIYLERKE